MIAVGLLVASSIAVIILLCDLPFWSRVEERDNDRWAN